MTQISRKIEFAEIKTSIHNLNEGLQDSLRYLIVYFLKKMPVLKSPMIASHRTRMAQLENSNKQLAIDSSG